MKLKYNKLYHNIIKEYQALSTCGRLQVAAILVENGRVISAGYNGVPSGQRHCRDLFKMEEVDGVIRYYHRDYPEEKWVEYPEDKWKAMHHEFAEMYEIHAEMNCIAHGFLNGVDVKNAELIVSMQPCDNCAKLIVASGIKTVWFINSYDRTSNSIMFLMDNGVQIEKL